MRFKRNVLYSHVNLLNVLICFNKELNRGVIMYKIGICGHFGNNKNLLNGQTIKTKILTEELEKQLGEDSIKTIDTYGWKRNPLLLLYKCYLLIKSCENIIILPASKGVKVFIPLFSKMNRIFHRKLHYVVIGGWLPKLLKNNL